MRESFVLYTRLYEAVEGLTLEQKGILFDAIHKYATGDEYTITDGIVSLAFRFYKNQLDIDFEKWEDVRQKRVNAGKLGGRPRKESDDEKQKKQMVFLESKKSKAKQTKAKKAVNVNVNVNENVNDIKEKELLSSSSKKKQQQFNKPTLQEVADYCYSMGYTFSPEAFHAYYESNGWKVGRNQMKNWKAACVTWQKKERENGNNRRNNEAVTTDEQVIRNTYELIAEAEGRDALGTVRMPF